MQVLLIDDERAIRRALREILEFEGCVVEEAENADLRADLFGHQDAANGWSGAARPNFGIGHRNTCYHDFWSRHC